MFLIVMYGKSDLLINHILLNRVLEIKHNNSLHNEEFDVEDLIEEIKLTRMGKMAESLSEKEMAVLILIAVQNYPEMVFQIMMEEYLLNKERNEKKDERRKDV